jgi:anti-sigma-K factor RskA
LIEARISSPLAARYTARMDSEQRSRSSPRAGCWFALWAIVAITCVAMALFAAAFFHGRESDLVRQLTLARDQLRMQSIEITRLNEAFAILSAPDSLAAPFGRERASSPKGAVFVSASQGVLLVATGLPPAGGGGKFYEMWLVPSHGMPQPAGGFAWHPNGTALYVHKGAVDLAAIKTIEVTLENQAGAPQPTSQPIIQADL